jgi:hypothetical protein
MEENFVEVRRKVLALLTTVSSGSARYRLREIQERLAELVSTAAEPEPAEHVATQ